MKIYKIVRQSEYRYPLTEEFGYYRNKEDALKMVNAALALSNIKASEWINEDDGSMYLDVEKGFDTVYIKAIDVK